MNKIELLAPAGNFEALAAAVESGADAVYLGGNKFNARAYADNFDGDNLEKAVKYAHIRGVKVYVTINILLSDRELAEALDYIGQLYFMGVDAIIVQDIALLKLVIAAFPDLEVHCSTQMTVHNTEGAKYYAGLGAKRVVLARELSLQEVTGIVEGSGIEIEVFVHGALCVSYSGQCLMSSMIGGRSGNRGRCAQPCRKKYSLYNIKTDKVAAAGQNKHIMSTRDLNTYSRLKELVAAGVTSLKIEGRMKRPEYVATVVKHYRDALNGILDEKEYVSETAEYELRSSFNREFTEGYLFNKRNREIVSIERPDNRGVKLGKVIRQKGEMVSLLIEENTLNDGDGIEIVSKNGRSTGAVISGIRVNGKNVKSAVKGETAEVFIRERVEAGAIVSKTLDSLLNKKAREEYSPENSKKIPIQCRVFIKAGEYPKITVSDDAGNHISYTDTELVEQAEKASASAGKLAEQLKKTGDTPYLINITEMVVGDNCFIPARQINRMRREILELLSRKRSTRYDRSVLQFSAETILKNMLIVNKSAMKPTVEYIAGIRGYDAAISAINSGVDTIYMLSDVYEGDIAEDASKLSAKCSSMGKNLFYVLPNITRDLELKRIRITLEKIISQTGSRNFGIVVSGPGQLQLAKLLGISRVRSSYSCNIFNSLSASHLYSDGIESVGLSPELNLAQIRSISLNCAVPMEVLVYGFLPVMTTEYCPVSIVNDNCRGTGDCTNSNYGIIDEKDKVFRIIKLDSCRTQLVNSNVLFLAEELGDIINSGISGVRLDFYYESPEEIARLIRLYRKQGNLDENDKAFIEIIKDRGFTKGHFYRGVE